MPIGGADQPNPDVSLVQAVGHSLMNGYGLTDQSLRASSRLSGLMGSAQEWNQSISGAVLGALTGGGVSWIWQRVGQRRYRARAPYVTASDLVVIQFGLNDMQALSVSGIGPTPSNTQGLTLFKNALRATICAFRVSAWFPVQNSSVHASVTLNGVWSAQANTLDKVGGRGTAAKTPGDGWRKTTANTSNAIVITIPDDYDGSPICLLFLTDPATTTATLTASGATTGTFDLTASGSNNPADTANTQQGMTVWRLTGIAASTGASQTLTIATSAITGAGGVNFAGWGIEASVPAPLIGVYDINYCNPASAFWGGIANTDVDTWNTGIQSVVSEFTDGTVVYVPTSASLGGIGKAAVDSLNGSHTNSVTTLTVASATNFTSSGCVMINPGIDDSLPGFYGTEIVKYTGKSGTTLTGCTRGAHGTTNKAWDGSTVFNGATSPSNPSVRQINEAAIPNFFLDGIHLTERGHAIMAEKADKLLARKASIRRTEAYRAGPGRADVRCQLRCSHSQLMARGSQTQLYWDISDIDTSMMHDPAGGPKTSTGEVAGNPGNWRNIFCKSDGLYQATVQCQWEIGRGMSSGQFGVAGVRKLIMQKAGGQFVGTTNLGVNEDDAGGYVATEQSLSKVFEWRYGESLSVSALQGGNTGPITATVTSASPTVTALSSMVGLHPGTRLFGTNIPAGAFVISMTATTLTMSANASGTTTAGVVNFSNQGGAGTTTTLNGAITNSATSITLTSTAGMFAGDMLRVDDEHILIGTVASGTSLTGCTRGQDGTAAVAHATAASAFTGIKISSAQANWLPLLSITRLQAI